MASAQLPPQAPPPAIADTKFICSKCRHPLTTSMIKEAGKRQHACCIECHALICKFCAIHVPVLFPRNNIVYNQAGVVVQCTDFDPVSMMMRACSQRCAERLRIEFPLVPSQEDPVMREAAPPVSCIPMCPADTLCMKCTSARINAWQY